MQSIAQEYDEYVLVTESGTRPMSEVTSMSDFNNLNDKIIDAAYGYTFVEDETLVKRNDEVAIVDGTKTFEANRILFNVEIKAIHDYGDKKM